MRLVIVSFNQRPDLAIRWNQQVGATLPHLIDPGAAPGSAGAVYTDFRFLRSVAGVWSPKSLRFYASRKLAGSELHGSEGQDVHVLAGDIVVAPDATVALPYYSKDNTDRPRVDDLLLLAQRLQRDHGLAPLRWQEEAAFPPLAEASAEDEEEAAAGPSACAAPAPAEVPAAPAAATEPTAAPMPTWALAAAVTAGAAAALLALRLFRR